MLEIFLPKILPDNVERRYHVFEGKQDLEKQIGKKLQNYQPSPQVQKFIIIRDQDSDDCIKVKKNLTNIAIKAKKQDTLVIN